MPPDQPSMKLGLGEITVELGNRTGWIAQWEGYGPAFLILGGFALGSLLIWTRFAAIVKPACTTAVPVDLPGPKAA
jgi:hypothetical protein